MELNRLHLKEWEIEELKFVTNRLKITTGDVEKEIKLINLSDIRREQKEELLCQAHLRGEIVLPLAEQFRFGLKVRGDGANDMDFGVGGEG